MPIENLNAFSAAAEGEWLPDEGDWLEAINDTEGHYIFLGFSVTASSEAKVNLTNTAIMPESARVVSIEVQYNGVICTGGVNNSQLLLTLYVGGLFYNGEIVLQAIDGEVQGGHGNCGGLEALTYTFLPPVEGWNKTNVDSFQLGFSGSVENDDGVAVTALNVIVTYRLTTQGNMFLVF